MQAIEQTVERRVPATGIVHLRKPYLVFIGDVEDALTAKTAFGMRDWIREDLVGQWSLTAGAIDLGLPKLDAARALAAGAGSVVIGAAPAGGQLAPQWIDALAEAARMGLDLVSGLHHRLSDIPRLVEAAAAGGAALHDIRHLPLHLDVGTGARRTGKRLLTVGTDCAIGKKYTALAVAREMTARGWDADFRATGQTGILIAGSGIPIDSVVADFIAGAAELLSPAAPADHWDVIEGQGSLFHPSYAGVSLGLLHGAQADALVLCTDPERREIDGCPGFPVPPIVVAVERYEQAARLTNPAARCVAIAVNTQRHDDARARALLADWSAQFGIPCTDPFRYGAAAIVDALG